MRGSLNPEAEEGGILGREFEADLAIDHRNRFRGHGEGCEGHEIGWLEEVDLIESEVFFVDPAVNSSIWTTWLPTYPLTSP